jgi:DNA-binding beta-propeller fold protein YncE
MKKNSNRPLGSPFGIPAAVPWLVAAAIMAFAVAAPSAAGAPLTAPKIYWAQNSDPVIRRANLDGGGKEELYRTPGGALDVAADPVEQKLYFSSVEGGGILKSDLDGTNVELAISVTEHVIRVAVDSLNRKVYWADIGGGSNIWRADLDGRRRESLAATSSRVNALEVDPVAGYYYWADFFTGIVRRTTLDNLHSDILISGNSLGETPLPTGLAIDSEGGVLYFSDIALNAILRVGLDGHDPTILITQGVVSPESIAFDPEGKRIYWSNRQRGFMVHTEYDYFIMSANSDGTDMRKEFQATNEWGLTQRVVQLAIIQTPVPEPATRIVVLVGTMLSAMPKGRTRWTKKRGTGVF